MGDIITRTLDDGRIVYYARYVELDGRRSSRKVNAKSEEEASSRLAAIEERVASGQVGLVRPKVLRTRKVAVTTMTVRQLIEKFCKNYQGDGLADVKHYRNQARSVLMLHVEPKIGKLDAGAVKRTDVNQLKSTLKADKKSDFIVSRALRQLSRVYNWAIEQGELPDAALNPVHGVKKPNPKGSTKYYTEEEVAKLLAWAAEHDAGLHPVIAYAFYTGCRKGEIAALRWSDIDWNGGRILVQRSWKRDARKSGESVTVNLNGHLRVILEEHQERAQDGAGEALVFPDARTGGMRPKHNAGAPGRNLWGLDVAIAGAKVRRFRYPWHCFRHAHGTMLALGGANLNAIQSALGQSSLEMASRYSHAAAELARTHVANLPALGPTSPTAVASLDDARKRRAVDTNGYGAKSTRTKKA